MVRTEPARGMRDFLPEDVRRREHVIGIVKRVYERYGYEPLETPAAENLETLMGKYGDEGNQLIFKILKRGEHEASGQADLALRYDLTVPLARVIAHHQSKLPRLFKRYQIQPVWRADRPARGRFREFYMASRLAVEAVEALWNSSPPDLNDEHDIQNWLDDAIDAANTDIFKTNNESGHSMGTTLVVAVQARAGNLVFAHVGDSRVYSSRSGLLTFDHSISAHQLLRSVGTTLSVSASHDHLVAVPGSKALICTDGLNKVVSDPEIVRILSKHENLEILGNELVEMALGFGGPDNITLILIEYL